MTTATVDALASAAAARVRPIAHWQDRLAQAMLLVVCLALVLFLLAPLFMILVKSVQDRDGAFVGLQQFREYFDTPALRQSILHTLSVAGAVTAITVPLAFTFAYALTRSCMPLKGTLDARFGQAMLEPAAYHGAHLDRTVPGGRHGGIIRAKDLPGVVRSTFWPQARCKVVPTHSSRLWRSSRNRPAKKWSAPSMSTSRFGSGTERTSSSSLAIGPNWSREPLTNSFGLAQLRRKPRS